MGVGMDLPPRISDQGSCFVAINRYFFYLKIMLENRRKSVGDVKKGSEVRV